MVSERIAELRADKEALEETLAEVGAEREEAEDDELAKQLEKLPDLSKALAEAQRQVFEAFELQIAYDKVGRRIELCATVSEAVSDAFENTKALRKEGSVGVVRDIAGARYVPHYHPRIVERMAA